MKFKPKGLVLDLRQNRGGKLTAAKILVSLFAPKGHIIYAEKTAKGVEKEIALENGAYLGTKISVLVDSDTSGAAEVAALSFQTLGYPVIGEQTCGKHFHSRWVHELNFAAR